MGLAQSGKTTIVKVTAEGFVPQKKAEYTATLDYKRNTYELFGTKVSMFDLGGQKSFLDRFIGELAEFVFTNVSTLIFVVDVANMDTISLAKYYYSMGKKTLKKYSPKGKTKILLHKMDLIAKDKRDDFISSVKEFLEFDKSDTIFETNVFDNSIFIAMEKIIKGLNTELDTFSGVLNRFKEDHADYLESIIIQDHEGKDLGSSGNVHSEIIKLFNKQKFIKKTSNDSLVYAIDQFSEKLVFTASLKREHFLIVVFLQNLPEILDITYTKLINGSIRLINDLNQFL
jgi:GTPase SAR1 family protein